MSPPALRPCPPPRRLKLGPFARSYVVCACVRVRMVCMRNQYASVDYKCPKITVKLFLFNIFLLSLAFFSLFLSARATLTDTMFAFMAQVRSVGLMLKMYTLLRQERENLVRLRGLNGTGLLPKVLIAYWCAFDAYWCAFDAYWCVFDAYWCI